MTSELHQVCFFRELEKGFKVLDCAQIIFLMKDQWDFWEENLIQSTQT